MGYGRWTTKRFEQGWCPNPIPASLLFPAIPEPPPVPVTFSFLVDDVPNFLIDDEGNKLRAQN